VRDGLTHAGRLWLSDVVVQPCRLDETGEGLGEAAAYCRDPGIACDLDSIDHWVDLPRCRPFHRTRPAAVVFLVSLRLGHGRLPTCALRTRSSRLSSPSIIRSSRSILSRRYWSNEYSKKDRMPE